MTDSLPQLDATLSRSAAPPHELAEVLENYLADLERGVPADCEALLAAHPELADALRPYLESIQRLHAATQGLRDGSPLRASAATSIGTGGSTGNEKIGDYRIARQIGRGGMGIVYEAHQISLNRPVALKILPFAAVLDQRQIARFRNEAQAAAQLHHPHIVPVFAVGQENGIYYYAMQLIDGQSLEEAIAELRNVSRPRSDLTTVAQGGVGGSTTTVERGAETMAAAAPSALSAPRSIRASEYFRSVARLGQQAAEALHHAHQYGIIHRDVKPSNLLLDRHGKLWVTDFGLARIASDSGVTLTGDVVGTLRYMSPEQAAGRAELVDHRTDVYSLGVTLYELLTLEHAFAGDDRHVVMRQIERHDPLPPRRLNPAVPVDLETIILHAMAMSRDDRYVSAAALADDLGRFLAGQPALARRPGPIDRAAKWARRHRAVVSVAAIGLFVLSVVSSAGMVSLMHERSRTTAALALAEEKNREARENFQRAEENFLRARDAVDQLGVGYADRLAETPGTEPLRRDLLARTLHYYGQFIEQAEEDPQLQHEAAIAHFKSGVIAAKLGDADQATAHYHRAENILATLHEAQAGNALLESQLALVQNNLAILAAARGDAATARHRYAEAIAIGAGLVARNADNPQFAAQLAESQSNLAMLYDADGKVLAAERLLREAVALLRPLVDRPGSEPRYSRNLSIAANNLSYVLGKRDPAAAEATSREAIQILERLADQRPERMQYQDDLALCYNNLAALYSRGGRTADAIVWHGRAVELQEQMIRKSPAVVRYRSDLAISLNNLGVAYGRAGKVDLAEQPFNRARELFATLASDYPDQLAYRSSLAALLNNQALAWAGAGRHERAVEIYPAAIDAQSAAADSWQQSPRSELMQQLLSKMVYNYGQSLAALGRWDEASEAALLRRDIWRDDGERLFGVAVELAELARQVRDEQQRPAAADEVIERLHNLAVATLRQAFDRGYSYPVATNLAGDRRFAELRGNVPFEELVAELSQPRDRVRKLNH
jgi:serine/threonine protein kinase